MRALLIVAVILVSAASARTSNAGEMRSVFKDWLATCRPDGYCSATTYVNPSPGNGTVADYVLRIGRQAEQTYWEIAFTPIAANAGLRTDFAVSVDGKEQNFAQPDTVAAYGSANDFYFLGREAQTLMDRMTLGQALDIDFTDSKSTPRHAGFSLSGLGAALMWIDRRQHRIGSERVAGAPPYGLNPPDLPYMTWMMPALDVFQ